MSSEHFVEQRAVSQFVRQEGRDRAAESFDAARVIAARAGLELVRFTESHYGLKTPRGQLNIYPGNQRLYGRQPLPFVRTPTPWALLDVVQGMIAALAKLEAK